ncbi:unnamed protein product, partial [Brassica oleracea var. botrytis]
QLTSSNDVNLICLPCSSLPPHERLCLKLPLPAANRRICLGSPDHLRRLSLPTSSCSDSSIDVMLILAASVSLQKMSSNNGDFLCFATQAPNLLIFSN